MSYGVGGTVPDDQGLTFDVADAPLVGTVGAPMPEVLCGHARSVLDSGRESY
jgi:hypothetical protein